MYDDHLKNANTTTINPPYPNKLLKEGDRCSEVARVQTYLNEISLTYFPQLENVKADGLFRTDTRKAVAAFQAISGLKTDGIVGRDTWNRIVLDYNAIAGGGVYVWPGMPLAFGENSTDVAYMQRNLNAIQPVYTAINRLAKDGKYGQNMYSAVRRFQKQFNLSADGVIGQNTWSCLLSVYESLNSASGVGVTTPYPGAAMQTGSEGDSVRFVQSYLDRIRNAHGFRWPALTVDGVFGCVTQNAVTAFQTEYCLNPAGTVGFETWERIVQEFNLTLY